MARALAPGDSIYVLKRLHDGPNLCCKITGQDCESLRFASETLSINLKIIQGQAWSLMSSPNCSREGFTNLGYVDIYYCDRDWSFQIRSVGIPAKFRSKQVQRSAVQMGFGKVLTIQETQIEAAWMICDSVMRNAPSHRAINPSLTFLSYVTDPLIEGARGGPSVKPLNPSARRLLISETPSAATRMVLASASLAGENSFHRAPCHSSCVSQD